MQSLKTLFSNVLTKTNIIKNAVIPSRGIRYYPPPPNYEGIEIPDNPKPNYFDRVPTYPPNVRPPKMQKRLRYMRGPEPIHNSLIHKQYGIIAKSGGRLKWEHLEMIRISLVRKLDFKRMFVVWRVDAPWQPVTKKGQGQRMGGGKGAINHYVTPIKAERVIVEVAGKCEFIEVRRILEGIAARLPLAAIAVSQKMLDEQKQKEKWIEEENMNDYTMKYIIQNNMLGCKNWLSPIDHIHFGKYK